MKVLDLEQGSAEWRSARLGMVSASRMADMLATTKTGWGASRANYAAELIVERLTGTPTEKYTNAAMAWGTENEEDARNGYAFLRDAEITSVGLVLHPTIEMACASPDGLVGDHGLIEVKCPLTATHIETLLSETIPDKYAKQMQWQMACTGRQWCDFVSFDPRVPAEMQFFIRRVERDSHRITEMEAAVKDFLAEIASTLSKLQAKFQTTRAAA
ncbi:MAG: YqaJ viral recombinase family protein [Hyphomicrobium sp.]|jgi:putative phage-type endonuclease|uniref:lambda exonuclease family protein n=1 Tax=Hyphomicrobium sp. TaxID=82 RepID=UPI0025C042C5|nr:lambda exonuclease family protein [Hyphomicrobium sp.]MBX9862441.1 YqaJ viral recombinase family protein [Hyphomicrobium sp.]